MNYRETAEALYEHALNHYNEDGWDMVVETMTIDEIGTELEAKGKATLEDAIAYYLPSCQLLDERRAEIRAEIY